MAVNSQRCQPSCEFRKRQHVDPLGWSHGVADRDLAELVSENHDE
jgi:hypothetical protein